MNSKQVRIRLGNGLIMCILGIIIVFLGYAAWGMFTLSYKAHIYVIAGIFLTIITAMLYIILAIMAVRAKKTMISRQLTTISVFGFVISVLLLFRAENHLVLISIWIAAFAISFVYGKKSEEILSGHIIPVEVIKKYRGIIFVLLITCVFLYDKDAVQARWDGLLYYLTCRELNIGSLSSLAVYGHIAQTYGMLNGIGNMVVGNTLSAMIGLNILLLLSSIVGFYILLREIIPGREESQYAIAAAAYAWSPFLLGMVYYHSLDFYCSCIFVWVLYAFYKRRWIYFSVFSLLFCFTKEPAIVIYAAMCAGIVLCDIIEDHGHSFLQRIQRCFARKQYYLMVLPGILWLATYEILGPWSAGNGGFSIDIDYALNKLKNLYVLNFNWVFALLAVGGSIYLLIIKRDKARFKMIFPIWCSQIAFTLFSCLFSTVNHPRYNDTNQVTLYLLAMIPLLCWCSKVKSGMMIGALSCLCLLSSFITCDPLTRRCYDQADIGGATMIYVTDTPLGDGMIYNRQMLGFEATLGNALDDALSDSQAVLFPTLDNNAYMFDGMAEVGEIPGDYMVQTEIWDDTDKRRVVDKTDSTIEFQAYQLTDHVDWSELEQSLPGSVSYIYLSTVADLYSAYIKENYQVLEETEYEHRGWAIRRICFETGT